MKLLPRRLRPAPRPAPVTGTLHALCDRRVEGKVRALCVLAFASADGRLDGLRVVAADNGATVLLRVDFTLDGPSPSLERLVDRLSGERGVRGVRWNGGALPATMPSGCARLGAERDEARLP
ncbi:hypothetical protein [Streptomyces luteireticuli]|uniref:hypothetical protein n=1 Tax=Streptomyces luteireticuli TaxID=173858 RepID=UPI0035573C53